MKPYGTCLRRLLATLASLLFVEVQATVCVHQRPAARVVVLEATGTILLIDAAHVVQIALAHQLLNRWQFRAV